MGQSYEQVKTARSECKASAISELLIKKESSLHGTVVSIKKGRGRPPGKRTVVVEEEAVAIPAGRPKKRGRGRPKGSKNKPKSKNSRSKVKAVSPVVSEASVDSGPKKRGRKKGPPNAKEISVMKCLNGSGKGRMRAHTIKEIAHSCFPDATPSEACLWVRTSLRRPVNENWVEKAARGEYRLNQEGRVALRGFAAS
jgi:hypothetical protein